MYQSIMVTYPTWLMSVHNLRLENSTSQQKQILVYQLYIYLPIYLSTYLPFFLSYFLSLATSWISLFCRYCVLTKIIMSVPNKARLSTNIKSCHCCKFAGCHVTLRKADFSISRTLKQSDILRCIASIFLIV